VTGLGLICHSSALGGPLVDYGQGEQAKFFSRYVNCVTCDGSPPDR